MTGRPTTVRSILRSVADRKRCSVGIGRVPIAVPEGCSVVKVDYEWPMRVANISYDGFETTPTPIRYSIVLRGHCECVVDSTPSIVCSGRLVYAGTRAH